MAAPQFIRVVNWKRFQHYKDRNPPWIKMHRELLTSRTWVAGDDASRVLAITCMLLAAETDNKIPLDVAYLRRRAYLNQEPDFSGLVSSQFIEIVDDAGSASIALADCKQNARPETETETETEKTLAQTTFADDRIPSAETKNSKPRDSQIDVALNPVWNYYLTAVDRNPKTYTFTDMRRKKGHARLKECLARTGGDIEKAVALMKLAVDGLAASDFHMGRDPKTGSKRYVEWDSHLFGSYERMELWWNEPMVTAAKPNGHAVRYEQVNA